MKTIITHYLELEDVIPFGKYKDKMTVEQLVLTDLAYVDWVKRNITDYKFDVKVLDLIKKMKLVQYAENVSKYCKPTPKTKNQYVVEVDTGGGCRTEEEETGWYEF